MYQLSDDELNAVMGGVMDPVSKKLLIGTVISGSAALFYTQSPSAAAFFAVMGCMITGSLIAMADPDFMNLWYETFIEPHVI